MSVSLRAVERLAHSLIIPSSERAKGVPGVTRTSRHLRSSYRAFRIVSSHPISCVSHLTLSLLSVYSSMVVHMYPNKEEQRTRLIGCSVIWSFGTIGGFIL